MEEGKDLVPAETKLNVNTALQALKSIPGSEEAMKIVEAYLKQNVIMLGTDQAFTIRDSKGEIKAYRQRLHLSQEDGTLTKPVSSGPFVVSAQGYEKWAEAVGANVVLPPSVLVGSQWMPNPAEVRDPTGTRVLYVYARALARAYSSKGVEIITDWTTIYDKPAYRMIDLLAKAKDFPQAFKLLPKELKPDGAGTWAMYPFDEATCLYMNTSHDEALKWLSQILNREKKAIDFAQTFARRNAVKHLSALQKSPGPTWDINILCWRRESGDNSWDYMNYLERLKPAKITAGVSEGVPKLELKRGVESISEEEGADQLLTETDPEDQAPVTIGEPEKPPIDVAPEKVTVTEKPADMQTEEAKKRSTKKSGGTNVHPVIKNFEVARESFPEEYKMALANLGINPDADIMVPAATKIIAEINKIVDKSNV